MNTETVKTISTGGKGMMTSPSVENAINVGVPTLRTFLLEENLVDEFVRLVPSVFGETIHRREVELGARIADIVAWATPTTCTNNIIKLRRVTVGDLALLAHLLERPLSVDSLATRTHADTRVVLLRMQHLERLGLVSHKRTAYRVGVWADNLPTEVFAVEAKLQDWRTAVTQASYYSRFVDSAWVLLPADIAAVKLAGDTCRALGIGLLIFDGVNVTKPVRAKQQNGPKYLRRLMKLKLAWNMSRHAND